MPFKTLSIIIIITLGLLPSQAALLADTIDKPNIIFIMADDLGYGQIGAYGQSEIKTPRIDQMAMEGLLLTDYYAGTSVCAPSRCALMTGMHVGHTFIRGNYEIKATSDHASGQLPIPDETITVAEKLKEADYRTACIGNGAWVTL